LIGVKRSECHAVGDRQVRPPPAAARRVAYRI
jgi:hypothetical protein